METQRAASPAFDEGRGRDLLKRFCAAGFDSDIERCALALGYQPEMIREILDGEKEVDEDLEIKMRGIAQERNFDL